VSVLSVVCVDGVDDRLRVRCVAINVYCHHL
jgi:hypothetical protein